MWLGNKKLLQAFAFACRDRAAANVVPLNRATGRDVLEQEFLELDICKMQTDTTQSTMLIKFYIRLHLINLILVYSIILHRRSKSRQTEYCLTMARGKITNNSFVQDI